MIPLHASAPIEALKIEPPQVRVTVGVYDGDKLIGIYVAGLIVTHPRRSYLVTGIGDSL